MGPSFQKKRQVEEHLQSFGLRMEDRRRHMLGYPVNLESDLSGVSALQSVFKFHVNNVGDPTEDSFTFQMHAHEFERDVLEWLAKLWRLDSLDAWGYVTSGGTEGNTFGVYLARELLPNGVLYTSDQAHYSVPKAARLCNIPMVRVASQQNGELDYDELAASLAVNHGRPAILVLNIGTTMKGAIDDADRVLEVLQVAGYAPGDFYIHCDAALSGMMLPFVKPGMIGFHKAIGSMSVSGHKFLGTVAPCGIVLTRKTLVGRISNTVEYIGMHDNTLSG